MTNRPLTLEEALASLRRSGERLMGLVDHGANTTLLMNEIGLACKHVQRLREIAGFPPDDIDGLLLAVHASRWPQAPLTPPVPRLTLEVPQRGVLPFTMDDEPPEPAFGVAEENDGA